MQINLARFAEKRDFAGTHNFQLRLRQEGKLIRLNVLARFIKTKVTIAHQAINVKLLVYFLLSFAHQKNDLTSWRTIK